MHYYFLGIGGIGMSALARYFHHQGHRVSGYDRTRSRVTDGLEALGIYIHDDLNPRHLAQAQEVIYTPAIKDDNPLFCAARDLHAAGRLRMVKRAQVLGEISARYRSAAVAGTHGKTTTSAMLTHLLRAGGQDCTAFLGGMARNLGDANFCIGTSDIVVAEADEFDRSFLHLHPAVAIITSTDPDHLDIYGDPHEMARTYAQFAGQVQPGGHLLLRHGLPLAAAAPPTATAHTYGVEAGDCRATHVRIQDGAMRFDFHGLGHHLAGLTLHMPGLHNVENATAAIAAAILLGADPAQIPHGMATFQGIWRRFEQVMHTPDCTLIDDYAHHPTEIAAAIAAARMLFPRRQLVAVFQPHLYTRTRDFLPGFAEALAAADEVLLLPIYPARELPIEGIDSQRIQALLHAQGRPAQLLPKAALAPALCQIVAPPSVVLMLGAGDIDREVAPVAHALRGQFGE